MFTILIVLIVLICFLLTAVVLSQSSKGDGLAGGLAAPGSIGTVFGVRRASDFLVKATIGLAVAFMVLCLLTNMFFLPTAKEGASAVQGGSVPNVTNAPTRPVQSAPAVAPS